MTPEETNQLISTYNDYLSRMADAARHFCEDLLESNYREVSEVLPALITGMQWVYESMEGFVGLGRLAENHLSLFRNVVNSLHEALENKDNVLLHDLLEYELIPLLDKIRVVQIELI